MSEIGFAEDGGEVSQEGCSRSNKLEADRTEGVVGIVVCRVGQCGEVMLEYGGHFMGVDVA